MVRPPGAVAPMGPVAGGRTKRASARRPPAPDPCDQAKRWAERTRVEQGFPKQVADLAAIAAAAVLLTSGREPVAVSDLPGRLHSIGVEGVATSDGGADGDRVEQGGDDGLLAGGGEALPLVS